MSWLKELANKAEAALERIDSETASVLKKGSKNYLDKHTSVAHFEHKRSSSYNQPVADRLSSVNHESRSWSMSAHNSLNSSPKDLKSRKRNFNNFHINVSSQGNESKVKSDHSRQSSSSSFDSSYTPANERYSPTPYGLDIDTSVDSGHVGSSSAFEGHQNIFPSRASSSASTTYSDGQTTRNVDNVTPSSINECEMLRKELASLNQDIQQVLKRAKVAERESGRLKSELSAVMDRQQQYDDLLCQSQQRELKLQRDLEETGPETSSLCECEKKSISGIVDNGNERFATMSSMSNGVAVEELQICQQKLDEAHFNLQEHKNATVQLRRQLSARIREMEDAQKATNDEVTIWRQRFESEVLTSSTYSQQVCSLKSELTDCKRDFDDYKAKAGRILEAKQALFDNLAQNKDGEAGFTTDTICQQEIEQMKTERAFLQEQLDNYGKIICNMKADVVEAELTSQKEVDRALSKVTGLENDLIRRQEELVLVKEQKNRAEQELGLIQEESEKIKHTLNKRLGERDNEIDKLQKQIAHKISSSIGTHELENRIHSLTESLILKQNSIEAITTDKHTLSIQCEKLKEQYTESQKLLNTDVKIYVDDYRNRQTSFMTESPFDGGVTRRVKKAYGCVDKFSIRLGTFLRRYPFVRMLILMYMGLLHLWVMIVLFTYTPEIHATTHNNG